MYKCELSYIFIYGIMIHLCACLDLFMVIIAPKVIVQWKLASSKLRGPALKFELARCRNF